MSSVSVSEWQRQLSLIRTNPAAVQRLALSMLEQTTNGEVDVVDANTPFMFLLESSAINSSSAIIEAAAETRKQYPSMAMTEDELYLHMSDADYAGRFANPARTTISILLEKDELYSRVVETGIGDIKKLTIPRHTEITVAGISFTMQYPIDIRVMAHGGLQIVYDVEKPSPLETLTTNIVDWKIMVINGLEFVRIDIPMSQFKITSHTAPLNLAQGFNVDYQFDDQFYYARAFYSQPDGSWKEMLTTHTDQVFDPFKPTALLKVYQGRLNVTLPQVYLTTSLANTELRIDVYTSRGPIEMDLGDYQVNAFTAKWIDLEKDDNGKYVAPLTAFSTMGVFSDKVVSGGGNAMTFEQLRERVMSNALGVPDLPITNVQVGSRLQRLGYDVVKDVDNITNRQFMATRTLPRPTDNSVVSGAGCTIQTLTASMVDLIGYDTVKDNGNRITLLPDTLYQSINGVLHVVPDATVAQLLALPHDIRARRVNEESYLYSPFHYVLDMNDDQFALRPYYLDNPAIESKSYVQENDTTGVAVATDGYLIERTAEGYKVTLTTKSSEAWKALTDANTFCQLSYRPTGEKDRAFQTGTLIGHTQDGERVYEFTLGTDYDVDGNDNIVLNTFSMYGDPERKHATPLTSDFDIIYIAAGLTTEGMQNSSIDLDLGRADLPADVIGISRERLSIRLGDVLKNMWASSRSVVSAEDYQKYTADQPDFYTQTVYARDANGAIIIVNNGGVLEYQVLHEIGDPVLDENGDPVYRHYKGDPVLDPDGKPVVIASRRMIRQCDLFLIDGVYWFADAASAQTYKTGLPQTITNWVNGDLEDVSKYLLEQTNLYFYPKSTLGQIKAIIMEDQLTTLPAAQSFAVTFYLRGLAYRDAALRGALSKMAVETINEALQSSTVTMSDIYRTLTERAGGDAIGVEVTGLGGAAKLSAVTLEDDSARLSIKKIATPLADGSITVEDDVAIAFIQHTPN